MLDFDIPRFIGIQAGAVALADRLDATIGGLLDSGARNIFFLGAGGAAILMQPAVHLLRTKSTFPVFHENAAELIAGGSRHLGPGSIVVIPSLSGTTKESIETLAYCKERGATVLTLVGHAATPLGEGGDHVFVNFAEDDTSSESFYIQSLAIALSIMARRGESSAFTAFVDEAKRLPEALVAVKQGFEAEAEAFAERIRNEPYHIITAAGSAWPQAFYYGMCILEEMQWIRTRPVHASDFFHGTLELLEPGVSLIVLKGEDEYRPLADRVEAFAGEHTDKLTVFDTASVDLPGIGPEVRALISPVVLATMLERVSTHLAAKRDHPLTTRRYYRRIAY
ncbi:SIS domain-containing protein [Bauldia litoralis]|uniref:Fructoselysine-6-P-deglycase FrlB with duplicated sugar isomerase (SIS) domain n=1 Tax=Bauldia litoralis TaxID=665467 RepID=A0A1G6BNY2_9HYPH|nr:SIS domain-containing protein [Bauldia litoralis]SDB22268.1 Fructoselysine-6-P-deglycase FrlB with duplicated sugar isomerase (SIS) domain [Bauldia litoralis]